MINYIQGKEDECCSVRKQKIIDREAVSEVLDDDGNVVRQAEAEESHEELYSLIKKELSKRENEIFNLKIKNYSYEEIQKKLGITPDQLYSAMRRIKTKIKNILDK